MIHTQLDEDEGQGLVTINRHLHLIADANQEAALNVTFSLSSLISNVDVDKFYTYKGKCRPRGVIDSQLGAVPRLAV